VKLLAELANDLSYSITAIRWREALRKSEERFHAIAANTPDHILMQDRRFALPTCHQPANSPY